MQQPVQHCKLILKVEWPTADDNCKFSKQRGSAFKRDSRVEPWHHWGLVTPFDSIQLMIPFLPMAPSRLLPSTGSPSRNSISVGKP